MAGTLQNMVTSFAYRVSQKFPQFVQWIDAVSAAIDSGVGITYTPATPTAWNPAPTSISGAIDELILNRSTFIFRSGGLASGNVFNTWASLYAATQAVAGAKTIVFDDTFGPLTIPVGAYDFGRGCVFVGVIPTNNSASQNRVEVTCAQGVTFTTPLFMIDDIRLTYTGTGALMTIPGDGKIYNFFMKNYARTNSTGAGGRIFDVASGGTIAITLWDMSAIIVAGGGLFYNALAGATEIDVNVNGGSQVNGVVPVNCFAGVAGPTYVFSAARLNVFSQGTATLPASQQNGMPGGSITPLFYLSSATLQYTPAAGAQWVDPDPPSVKAALDRIAAVVSVGGATPIP